MTNSTNYFQEKLETLPDHVRWAIRDVDYMKELAEIKKKHKLHIDQAATLESLAQHLMLGDIDAATFMSSLFKEAYISSQIAADILVDIDTMILRRIREKIESFEQEEKEIQRHRDQFRTDEEVEIDDMNTLYRQKDEEYVRVTEEIKQELAAEGFKEDGSNITDEDIAKSYGMTMAEYLAQNRQGAIKAAQEAKDVVNTTPTEILSEKEELMRELESPEKSFAKPLFAKKAEATPVMKKVGVAPLAPDHQLQNTRVEEPFHDDVNAPLGPTKAIETTPTPITTPNPTENIVKVVPKPVDTTPIIKKPAKIDLGADPYREPIE